jgi:hypothetical protein
MITLGYELGTGSRVDIPLGHMIIVGQTSRAGKTTTLEACAVRSARKCIAFLTKRGEGSFRLAREIPPYYQEGCDWRTVRSLCEAITQEKWSPYQRQALRLVSEDGDLGGIKSRIEWPKPESLSALQDNITLALTRATGKLKLALIEVRSDLRIVVKELERLRENCGVPDLKQGLNVVNLESHERHIQSLVVSSTIRWVREHGEKTIVAMPEAWKFAPGRGRSPVGDAAQEYIREGAALENFLWIDSQTIGGLSLDLLSQIRVWLFGVQRLRSEIERTLDAIPDNLEPHPRAGDIMNLDRGEFIACFDQEMYRTYVQPAWMGAAHAEAIARGEEPVESAREIVADFDIEHRR